MVEMFQVLTEMSEKFLEEEINSNFVIGEEWLKHLKGKLTKCIIAPQVNRKALASTMVNNAKLMITIYPPTFIISIERRMHKEKLEILRLLLENKITVFSLSEGWLYAQHGGFDSLLSSINFPYTSPYFDTVESKEKRSKVIGRIGESKQQFKFKEIIDLIARNVEYPITFHGGFEMPIQRVILFLELHKEDIINDIIVNSDVDAILVGDITHEVKQAIILSKIPVICLGRCNLENTLLAKIQRILMEQMTIDLPELFLVKEEPFGIVHQKE